MATGPEAHDEFGRRALRALRDVNRLVVRTGDRDALVAGICSILTDSLGYHNAWIGLCNDSGSYDITSSPNLKPVFRPVEERLRRGLVPACATRVMQGDPFLVLFDPPSACPECPLAFEYTGRAAFCRRLEHGSRVFGVLTASVPAAIGDDLDAQELFAELTDDVAFALRKIEMEERRVRVETERELTLKLLGHLSSANNIAELTGEITKLMRDWSGCEAVGIRLCDGDGYPFVKALGLPPCFVADESELRSRDPHGSVILDEHGQPELACLCGRVIRGQFDPTLPFFSAQGSFWTNSTSDLLVERRGDPFLAETRNRCNSEGYESVALVPLRYGEETIGLLQFNDSRRNRFSEHDIALFERLAANLALGLHQRRAAKALRESEQRYRMLVNSDIVASAVSSRSDGVLLEVNHGFEKLTGFSHEELIGRSSVDLGFLTPDQRRDLAERLERDGTVNRVELTFPVRDGVSRTILGSVNPIMVRGESCLLATLVDITERKQAEVAIERRDAILKAVAEAAALLSTETGFSNVFRGAIARVGQAAEASRAYIFSAREDDEGVLRVNQDFEWVEDGISAQIDNPDLADADFVGAGFGRWVEVLSRNEIVHGPVRALPAREQAFLEAQDIRSIAVVPVFVSDRWWGFVGLDECESERIWSWHELDALKAAAAVFGAAVQRQQTRDALQQSADRYRLATRAGGVGVWDWDLATDAIHVDPVLKEMLGYADHEIRNHMDDWGRHVHPDDAPIVQDAVAAVLNGASDEMVAEHRMVRRDGSHVWLLARGSVVRDASGRPARIVGTDTDISDRKEAEAERERLHGQLVQKQKLESIGRFAGVVAHDFNNMIGVIMGSAELFLMQASTEDPGVAEMQDILEAAESSAELTRQLLGFARRQAIAPVALNLNDVTDRALKMVRRVVPEDIQVTWAPGSDLWTVKLDPVQVEQVLTNLVVNARDALSGPGTIAISTSNVRLDADFCAGHPGASAGDHVMLAVADDGEGMDDDTRSKVFEPFFTTKSSGLGTGLGLASVYGIVKQNDGYIDIESAPGSGTTVRAYIPRHRSDETEPLFETTVDIPHGDGEAVMVVEDEAGVLEMTRRMVTRLGYRPVFCGGPSEAVTFAQNRDTPIDLLITDVIMPEMNGRELAEAVCRLHPETRVLFMSGYTDDAFAERGILEGGTHLVTKPFSLSILAQKIRDSLSR